jgi:hypothetical protein
VSLQLIYTRGGPVSVMLPDRVSGQVWKPAEKVIAAAAAGDPTALGAHPDARPPRCRCGQAALSFLEMRVAPTPKTLCLDCRARPLPVRVGEAVSFRLADSDLFPYCMSDADEIELRGVVDLTMQVAQDVAVTVEGWPIPHTVSVDLLMERPARLEDMREFWPDKTPAELQAVYAQMRDSGHQLMVRRSFNEEDQF